jgi:methionyl-tRNA formyltransferase
MAEPIVFFGNERIATGVSTDTPVLRALIENGYHIAAVVANYEQSKSRNGRDLEVAKVAAAHGIPLLLPDKLSDIHEQLIGYQAVAGALIAYGKIIPQSVIDIFPSGIINIHPSLLPLHRGPIPLESVILDGSTKTGVSLMQLVKAMDAGPVFAQSEITLDGAESKQFLADKLTDIGSAMLIDLLPGILAGDIVGMPQDETAATYDERITKEAGLLDFSKTAVRLEREIRAYLDWPKSRTTLASKDVVITKAHVLADNEQKTMSKEQAGTVYVQDKQLCFQTSDGVLVIDSLKPAGKPEMSASAFLAGNRGQL